MDKLECIYVKVFLVPHVHGKPGLMIRDESSQTDQDIYSSVGSLTVCLKHFVDMSM